jgi:hypothetical protein
MNDFKTIINQNQYLFDVLKVTSSEPTEKFYIGAGAVAQTIWNSIFGYESTCHYFFLNSTSFLYCA